MDPRDFIELAERLTLSIGSPKPSNLRTATSRAYYGVHHVGVETLTGMGLTVDTGTGSHRDVSDKLQNCGNQEVMAAGSKLSDLHSARIKADYRLKDTRAEHQTTVNGHVKVAKNIAQIIDQVCSGPDRANIINAIKKYDKLIKGGTQ